jgi:2-oxoglutarate ferredoxin oxidoreductase subunit alpha
VPEINLGQMVLEVERCMTNGGKIARVSHAGGSVHDPETIYRTLVEVCP